MGWDSPHCSCDLMPAEGVVEKVGHPYQEYPHLARPTFQPP